TTHFDMDSVEAVGLVKMDILAQGGLAVMRDVQQMLCKDPARAPFDESTAPSPSPQPSPQGRGRIVFRLSTNRSVSGRSKRGRQHSLSLGERVGVRGKEPSELAPSVEFEIQRPTVPPPTLPPPFNLAALEPWADPQILELIASGNARAVHHIESPAMISLSKMCNVHDIDTLIAIVSVIRPGAANEIKKMEFALRY